MSDLQIYGTAPSRAFRTLWMAEELGLAYTHHPVNTRGGTRTPEFLALNPNGHVPVIQDGALVLCESMAINLYLARKHGKRLWPDNLADEGRAYQWTFWAVNELEGLLIEVLLNRLLLAPDKRDEAAAIRAIEEMQKPLAVLESALATSDYLLGPAFTVADLNVASVLSWARVGKVDLSAYAKVTAWLRQCFARPASRKVAEMARS